MKKNEKDLCRAFSTWRTAKMYVCRAPKENARQRYMFAVRFTTAHGKVFSKKLFFAHLLISPLQNIILYYIFQSYACLD
jgi:hypothetical protein